MLQTVSDVLCPTDFSELSYEALDVAANLARDRKARLHLLHVVRPVVTPMPAAPPTATDMAHIQEGMVKDATDRMERLVNERVPSGLEVLPRVVLGSAADEIAEYAEEKKVDLVVISTHGKSGLRRYLFGSVAEKVLRLATCPVLVIPSSATG